VLIVCGAGASSTFLALRLRRIAKSRGLDLVVEAGTLPDVDDLLPDARVLLIGPHLDAHFSELRERADRAGAEAVLLPDTVFGPEGAESAADVVMQLLASKEIEHHG
jgi:PTS system cellobiose-specific IIB component